MGRALRGARINGSACPFLPLVVVFAVVFVAVFEVVTKAALKNFMDHKIGLCGRSRAAAGGSVGLSFDFLCAQE
jgi:hypothetical protein